VLADAARFPRYGPISRAISTTARLAPIATGEVDLRPATAGEDSPASEAAPPVSVNMMEELRPAARAADTRAARA
jgi:hypothetical protein